VSIVSCLSIISKKTSLFLGRIVFSLYLCKIWNIDVSGKQYNLLIIKIPRLTINTLNMNVIESFLPLNTKEKIDQLMAIIKSEPKAMNQNAWHMIFGNIGKSKMQMYFIEKYPQSLFAAPGNYIPSCNGQGQEEKNPQQPQVQQHERQTDIPVPPTSLKDNRFLYATYIEMAFHNMFLNIKHIYGVVFGRDIMAEAKANYEALNPEKKWDEDFANEFLVWKPMFEAFNNGNVEEKQKVWEMLSRHFPLLVPFTDFTNHESNYKNLTIVGILRRLSQVLRVLRNLYSHYRIELFENQKKVYLDNEYLIIRCTMNAYMGARRVIKDRFSYDEKDMRCTDQYQFVDERGRRLKEKVEIKGFRYKIGEKGKDSKLHFTPFGLVAFISLFLEKKYSKSTVEELIEERDRLQKAVDAIDNSDEELKEQTAKVASLLKKAQQHADNLTKTRTKSAKTVEAEIHKRLTALGMPNVQFAVELTCNKSDDSSHLTKDGQDKIAFMFSANKGMVLRPVSQVASGGEIARVMLSLKAMISGAVKLQTIIFDEIDTGVSGKMAEKMADIMKEMGEANRQVISITHLPQIAAKGSFHYKVEKHETENGTTSLMRRLNDEERVQEIAQMLSGENITDAALTNAKELLKPAAN
jgi:hypothetical protein